MKKGFTLFEILLAIAIIGIIIALTLPKVLDNYTNNIYARTLQSVSDAFKSATTKAFTEERVSSLADAGIGSSAQSFLQKYFKISKDCGTNHTDCLADTYRSLDKTKTINTSSMLNDQFYCVALETGAVICLTTMSAGSNNHGNSVVVVDINGKQKPNINGRDLFNFEIYSDGKIGNHYENQEDSANGTACSGYAKTAGYGGSCYSKIVADGWRMDY